MNSSKLLIRLISGIPDVVEFAGDFHFYDEGYIRAIRYSIQLSVTETKVLGIGPQSCIFFNRQTTTRTVLNPSQQLHTNIETAVGIRHISDVLDSVRLVPNSE